MISRLSCVLGTCRVSHYRLLSVQNESGESEVQVRVLARVVFAPPIIDGMAYTKFDLEEFASRQVSASHCTDQRW